PGTDRGRRSQRWTCRGLHRPPRGPRPPPGGGSAPDPALRGWLRGREWWSCELLHRALELLLARRDSVESGVVLHERDPLALHGTEDHARRLPAHVARPRQRLLDRIEVVAIDAVADGPAKGAVLLVQRIEGNRLVDEAIVLDAVAVDERDQV